GLMYGVGDFTQRMEISTRGGQSSDCNPPSAGGILGTLLGYDGVPEHWQMVLADAEDSDFKYTTKSLNDVNSMGMKHTLQVIERNGGTVSDDAVTIKVQKPRAVRLEQSFEGHYPVEKRQIHQELKDEYTLEFEGIGFALLGSSAPVN